MECKEKYVSTQLKSKDLELQLAEAKLQQQLHASEEDKTMVGYIYIFIYNTK